MENTLDKLFREFDEQTAQSDLARAHRRLEETELAIRTAHRARDEAREEIAALEAILAAYRRRHGRSLEESAEASTNGQAPRSGRAAIRELVAGTPGREWTTPEVARELGLGKQGEHGVQVALSRMYRAGELERPRKGVYRLPPSPQAEGEEQGDRATGETTG